MSATESVCPEVCGNIRKLSQFCAWRNLFIVWKWADFISLNNQSCSSLIDCKIWSVPSSQQLHQIDLFMIQLRQMQTNYNLCDYFHTSHYLRRAEWSWMMILWLRQRQKTRKQRGNSEDGIKLLSFSSSSSSSDNDDNSRVEISALEREEKLDKLNF